jgi:hypothetical protein
VSETKLAPIPTHVSATVDKDGRDRPAHIAVRHKKVTFTEEVGHEHETPLDFFIAKHGGAAHLRETLEGMEGHERAKLLDAMAHVEGTDAADVMKKLGIREPEKSELLQEQSTAEIAKRAILGKLDAAKGAGVITEEEYSTIVAILERDGVQAAVDAVAALRSSEEPPSTSEPTAASVAPAEGSAGLRASLLAQAEELYQRHVDAANAAQRADWAIEKRKIRGWRVSKQMTDAPESHRARASQYLKQWQEFCQTNGLSEALS